MTTQPAPPQPDARSDRAIDAVVFDLDGTLADTFALLLAAFDEATRPQRGRPLTHAEMVAHFGPGAGTEAAIICALSGSPVDAPPTDCLDTFYRVYEARHGELVRLFPGIRHALDTARERGCRIGLVTGKGRRSADITLRELGIAPYFDAIATGDDAPAPKPDPRGLLTVLERLGTPPARALFLGDSVADLGAGQAASTLVAAVLWNNPPEPALLDAAPDFLLRNGDDLATLLDRLTSDAQDQKANRQVGG